MAIGGVLAALAVLASRPSRPRNIRLPEVEQTKSSPSPTWKKDIAVSHPIGEYQYLEQIERFNQDPQHEPFPMPPPPPKRQ